MTDQLSLTYDDRMSGNYRRDDPVSSVAAGRTCNAEAQRGKILAVLRHADRPLYGAEIAAKTGIIPNEVTSRLAAMKHRGLVEMVGMGANHRQQPVQLWRAL